MRTSIFIGLAAAIALTVAAFASRAQPGATDPTTEVATAQVMQSRVADAGPSCGVESAAAAASTPVDAQETRL